MSKLSPHEDKMLNLQYQMKQNNQDLQNFLKDLDNWETEIKKKDETLKQKKTSDQEVKLRCVTLATGECVPQNFIVTCGILK